MGEIQARVQELLDKRGLMLDEVLNCSEVRKKEIYAWFEGMSNELNDLLIKSRLNVKNENKGEKICGF